MNAKLRAARIRCEQALYRNARIVEGGGEPGIFSVGTPKFVATPEEADAFRAELLALVARFEGRAAGRDRAALPPGCTRVRLAYALYDEPLPG